MLSIRKHDCDPTNRLAPRYWEGNLIIDKGQHGAIGILMEREFQYVKLLRLGRRVSTSLHHVIVKDEVTLATQTLTGLKHLYKFDPAVITSQFTPKSPRAVQ
jgi:IS30 family transposase